MNERPDELDAATANVDALARIVDVDVDDGWHTLLATATRRRRRKQAMTFVSGVLVVALAAGAVVYATRDSQSGPRVTTEPGTANGVPTDCELPAVPDPGSQQFNQGPNAATVAALRGAALQSTISYDSGEFRAVAPASGVEPRVSRLQAECAALASGAQDGWSMQTLAEQGGMAVGYGLVTIDDRLIAHATSGAQVGQMNRNTHPKLPAATPYHDRLAWIVVVHYVPVTVGGNGPNLAPATTSTTLPPGTSYGNDEIFVVDANTGTDALVYASGPAPSVIVPSERVSVPWVLVSRDPKGYAGTIRATVLPCDGVPDPVSVDRDAPTVAVVVERPVGASCGDPTEVELELRAGDVFGDLPQQLGHDALGPRIEPPPVSTTPTTSEKRIQALSQADNGRTIHLSVSDVVTVLPFVADMNTPNEAKSSDETVLGPLDPASRSELAELRAWRPGRADIAVPESDCAAMHAAHAPCPWVVHVIVDAP